MSEELCGFIVGRGNGHWMIYAYDNGGAEWRFEIPYGREDTANVVAAGFRDGTFPVQWENWDSMDYLCWED